MFTTVCPGCDSSLSAPDTLKGKKVKCKKCGEPFVAKPADETEEEPLPKTVKTPGIAPPKPRKSDDEEPTEETDKLRAKNRRPADDEDDTEIMEAKVVDEEESPRPKSKQKKGVAKRRKEKKSPAMLFVLIGVGALILLGGGSVGAYYAFFKEEKKTDPQATGGTTSARTTTGTALAAITTNWVEHVDAEGKYRIKFPKAPVTQTERIPKPDQSFQEVKMNTAQIPPEVFLAAHILFVEADRAGLTDEQLVSLVIDKVLAQGKGNLEKSRRAITYQGFTGSEVVVEEQGKKGGGILRGIIAGERVIILLAGGENSSPDSPRIKAFFESLKIE
jgi:hypothetical protein